MYVSFLVGCVRLFALDLDGKSLGVISDADSDVSGAGIGFGADDPLPVANAVLVGDGIAYASGSGYAA